MVKGHQVEIVPPDEVNSMDLAADVPGLELADVQFAPLAATASPTVLAQALSVIAGALAGALVGWLLIGWRSVRISWLEHHDFHGHQRGLLAAQITLAHQKSR